MFHNILKQISSTFPKKRHLSCLHVNVSKMLPQRTFLHVLFMELQAFVGHNQDLDGWSQGIPY